MIRLGVFDRRIDAVHDRRWQSFEVGDEGERRPDDLVIPHFVASDEIAPHPFGLLLGPAHPRHSRIVRLPDER